MKSLQPATREPLVMMVATAMLSALALVLFLLFEFPLLSAAPYLKMDFSDIPAIFGAVVFGPVCGVMVELIKNLLEMMVRGLGSQMGFGNIQNFLLGCAYLLPLPLFSRIKKENPLHILAVNPGVFSRDGVYAGNRLFQQLGGSAPVLPLLFE